MTGWSVDTGVFCKAPSSQLMAKGILATIAQFYRSQHRTTIVKLEAS